MIHNFMLFSDLQKKVTTTPMKTWRLLKALRDDGRMKAGDDWTLLDRKLYVNVPRFIVEIEHMGYANVKSDDFNSSDVKSDEIKKLTEELSLISAEIVERSIQEEMKSSEIKSPESTSQSAPPPREMKSDDINVNPNGQDLNSDDFTPISHEIIKSKNEVIGVLKDALAGKDRELESKERVIKQMQGVIDSIAQQSEMTTRQNIWLTNQLMAPKQPPGGDGHADAREGSAETHEVKPEEEEAPPEKDETPGHDTESDRKDHDADTTQEQ